MPAGDEPLAATGVAVLDPFSLYRIAVRHTPAGRALGDATRAGTIRLLTPVVAFAVACSMRTCWDESCDQDHRDGTGVPVRRFQELGGTELVSLSPTETIAAGQLYAAAMDHRVTGAEVLAACHCAILARASGVPVISAARASYCYATLDRAELNVRVDLI
ncbi:hypothetical protein AB0D49_26270 [Streptomyces sp. NPDC048290]|uniref:hypothetical protein n=1 Tax=Streptomyces sp. NPDC048290 TaxID=3155811 RepID=UPI0034184B9D